MTLTNHSRETHNDEYDEADSAWTRKRALLLLLILVVLALLLAFGGLPLLESIFNPRPELPPLQPPVQV